MDLLRDDGATSSLWWVTRNEWLGLVDVTGLEVEALYGGFAGEPFTDDSCEYVFVAKGPLRRGIRGAPTKVRPEPLQLPPTPNDTQDALARIQHDADAH